MSSSSGNLDEALRGCMTDNRKSIEEHDAAVRRHKNLPNSDHDDIHRSRIARLMGAGIGVVLGIVSATMFVKGQSHSVQQVLPYYVVLVLWDVLFGVILGDWMAHRKTTVNVREKWVLEYLGPGQRPKRVRKYYVDTDKGVAHVSWLQYCWFEPGHSYRVNALTTPTGIRIRSWFLFVLAMFWISLPIGFAVLLHGS